METISGNRNEVAERVWEMYADGNTPQELLQEHNGDTDAVVRELIETWGNKTFFWREMNAEYTAEELIRRYLEDNTP